MHWQTCGGKPNEHNVMQIHNFSYNFTYKTRQKIDAKNKQKWTMGFKTYGTLYKLCSYMHDHLSFKKNLESKKHWFWDLLCL